MRLVKALFIPIFILSGCASQSEPPKDILPNHPDFQTVATASCPDDVPFILPEKFELNVKDVGWGDGPKPKSDDLTRVSVFELTSSSSRFGGLSGLDFLDGDTLLTVSDMGELIWIDIDPETGRPTSNGYIALLKDEDGQPFSGKTQRDAEGIAWNGAYAFVSFERDHRVLGYDLEGCGGNARGIPVATVDGEQFDFDQKVTPNQSLEALTDFGDGLIAGLETVILRQGEAPITIISAESSLAFDKRLKTPEITRLVGLEIAGAAQDILFALTRSYDPLRGNRIGILKSNLSDEGEISNTERLDVFGRPLTVDNYEGIAAQTTDGGYRLFLISDNNFSGKQRTLLAVLDYKSAS